MIKNIRNIIIVLIFISLIFTVFPVFDICHNQEKISLSKENFDASSSFGRLSYEPVYHNFGDKYPGVVDKTTFEIWNSGCCSLVYSLIEECKWVSVNPSSGVSSGEWDHHVINVTINTTGLTLGVHTCDIIIDTNDNTGIFTVEVKVIGLPNNPPMTPTINGPDKGKSGEKYQFTAKTNDPENDPIFYKWKFEDINVSEWLGPYWSNEKCQQEYVWNKKGSYKIKVKAKDEKGYESNWSAHLSINIDWNYVFIFGRINDKQEKTDTIEFNSDFLILLTSNPFVINFYFNDEKIVVSKNISGLIVSNFVMGQFKICSLPLQKDLVL
ncbi:MAG: PKD domain-containing protein [Candidatus Thermoplasmatota archaeon]